MDREFDIIVHGASGFTARFVVKNLLETDLKFALSGRSEERIKVNIGFSSENKNIPIFETTSENLPEVTKRARVVVNCAGPYILCGEEVVKACVATKTHYVDITGEPLFIEKMISKYHEEAKKNKVLIVPTCGFDSIPSDIGVSFLKQIMGGKPIWARGFIEIENTFINFGTYNTLIHSLSNVDKLKELRKSNEMSIKDEKKDDGEENRGEPKSDTGAQSPKPVEKDRLRKLPFFSPITQSYCVLFPGADASVVRRSQKILSSSQLSDPIQYSVYYSVGDLLSLMTLLIWGISFFLMTRLEAGRKLLLKYPEFFTLGRVRKSGPTDEMIEKAKFSVTFEGLCHKEDGKKEKVKAKVHGPDPGYIITSACAVVSAILLVDVVKGVWKPAFEGGVLTPAAAFHGSDIVERLKKKELMFEEISRETVS